jgi:hypothetical protein
MCCIAWIFGLVGSGGKIIFCVGIIQDVVADLAHARTVEP